MKASDARARADQNAPEIVQKAVDAVLHAVYVQSGMGCYAASVKVSYNESVHRDKIVDHLHGLGYDTVWRDVRTLEVSW